MKRNGRKRGERRKKRRSFFHALKIHPVFLLVGVWYACKGELFLFLMSTLVALQHECAHAFAAAKLGYKLRAVVLMPFGAVIDGDLSALSLKDEIYVAVCGPLCNLVTALFFGAIWWFVPTTYAFTDTAFYASLSIALVNLLPAYPLDGGRIFKCVLARGLTKHTLRPQKAERIAEHVSRAITLAFATAFFVAFALQCIRLQPNFSLLAFAIFLLVGALGNKSKLATYEKVDFALPPSLSKGVEIHRVAIACDCPIKDAFRFVSRGSYLVLEVYDEDENQLFELSQSRLSALFLIAETPYETLKTLYFREKTLKNADFL